VALGAPASSLLSLSASESETSENRGDAEHYSQDLLCGSSARRVRTGFHRATAETRVGSGAQKSTNPPAVETTPPIGPSTLHGRCVRLRC
jgi:hypothetical protein